MDIEVLDVIPPKGCTAAGKSSAGAAEKSEEPVEEAVATEEQAQQQQVDGQLHFPFDVVFAPDPPEDGKDGEMTDAEKEDMEKPGPSNRDRAAQPADQQSQEILRLLRDFAKAIDGYVQKLLTAIIVGHLQ
jgi:hypothetical protein